MLEAKIAALERGVKEDEAEYFEAKPVPLSEQEANEEQTTKGKKKKKPVNKKRHRETNANDVEDEMDKKAMIELKEEISNMVVNGTIPSDLAKQMISFNLKVDPNFEKINLKLRQLQQARTLFHNLLLKNANVFQAPNIKS